MRAAARLAGFGAALAVVLAGGYGIGLAVGPVPPTAEPSPTMNGHAAGSPRTDSGHLPRTTGDRLQPMPEPSRTASVDGLDVDLIGSPKPGRETALAFTVGRGGATVQPEPYLGARGHLVVLREGDLAYVHVHADREELTFMATFPTPGRYLLFLDFAVDGRVHTAPFTLEVPA